MSFKVIIRQRPEGQEAMLTETEMSNADLQLRLFRDLPNVMAINGQSVNIAQKRTLRSLGMRWEVIDVEAGDGTMLRVRARRDGAVHSWLINEQGEHWIAPGVDTRGILLDRR